MGNVIGAHVNAVKSVNPFGHEHRRWSDRIATRIASEGLIPVLKDELDEMVKVGAVDPAFLIPQIEKWVRADPKYAHLASPENLESLASSAAPTLSQLLEDAPVDGVNEGDGKPIKVYKNSAFVNWGGTVKMEAKFTFVPKTKAGVQSIVRYAKEHSLRVRVSGSRHCWTDVYGRDGDVMISMMEVDAAVPDEDWARQPIKTVVSNPYDRNNELQRIEFLGASEDRQHARIRLGGATTSEHFRQWALSEQAFRRDGGKSDWMLRALPVLVSITSAGWTQVICHGAGIAHKSVSDLCDEVELVNFKGELQTISDKEQLKAVAGGFGLLGVITSHVFVLDPLKIANLLPEKVPVPLGVPPLTYDGIPKNADFSTEDYTREEWEAARTKFKQDCGKFYAEWFWFPFNSKAWVNCWETEDKGRNRQPQYPTGKDVKIQNDQARIFWIFQNTLLKFLPPVVQADLTSFASMKFLPPHERIKVNTKTTVPDALHFRRGIHRMPVRDCEWCVEIPAGPDGPDWSVCQKLWWAAIEEVYKEKDNDKAPMRFPLEMRVVGGSDTIMSTQNGNTATCAIEVLTSTLVNEDEWDAFIVRVTDRWKEIAGELQFKPNFAKMWPKSVGGVGIQKYMKDAYADKAPEFVRQMSAAASDGGYSFDDALSLFGNDTIVGLIGNGRL